MATYIFGKTASYAQMFVESARYSGVDVVIVGSPTPTFELPPNVRHLSITWQELVARVSARLFEGEPLHSAFKSAKVQGCGFETILCLLVSTSGGRIRLVGTYR